MDANAAESSSSAPTADGAPWEEEDNANTMGPVVRVPEVWATGTKKRGLILMDVFCPYFGLYMANNAREAYGVCTISVLSNYMKHYFAKEQPQDWKFWLPSAMPVDINTWKARLPCDEIVAVHCESDSGLADSEYLAVAANALQRNDPNEARRDKFLMNQVVGGAGFPVVRQKLCHSLNETLEFASELLQEAEASGSDVSGSYYDAGVLGQGTNAATTAATKKKAYCIVKPTRGVASENVHLCHDEDSIAAAYYDITSSTVFGDASQKHQSVLVQEFAAGTEYAVDIVSKNGEHKVAALWRYDKRPCNGAPFCYFATELIDATQSEIGASVCRYAQSCLEVLGHRWGLSHTEVIVTSKGPRLVEVNCRQHNMDFAPITMACIGYNAFDMLLAAYLGDEPVHTFPPDTENIRLDWDSLPDLPALRLCGAMVHLVSFASGQLKEVQFPKLGEIHNMESCMEMEVYPEFLQVGEMLRKTTDIRSDAGWVQIVNDDKDNLKRDYDRIVELMPQLFTTE